MTVLFVAVCLLWVIAQFFHGVFAAKYFVQEPLDEPRVPVVLSTLASVVPLITLFIVIPNLASALIGSGIEWPKLVFASWEWLMLANALSFLTSVVAVTLMVGSSVKIKTLAGLCGGALLATLFSAFLNSMAP